MHFVRVFQAASQAFHLKCPPDNPETLLRKNLFDKKSLFGMGREHKDLRHRGERMPLEACLRYLP
jgi:hypothetical protein